MLDDLPVRHTEHVGLDEAAGSVLDCPYHHLAVGLFLLITQRRRPPPWRSGPSLNIALPLAVWAGTSRRSSQCSTILPPAIRHIVDHRLAAEFILCVAGAAMSGTGAAVARSAPTTKTA